MELSEEPYLVEFPPSSVYTMHGVTWPPRLGAATRTADVRAFRVVGFFCEKSSIALTLWSQSLKFTN